MTLALERKPTRPTSKLSVLPQKSVSTFVICLPNGLIVCPIYSFLGTLHNAALLYHPADTGRTFCALLCRLPALLINRTSMYDSFAAGYFLALHQTANLLLSSI